MGRIKVQLIVGFVISIFIGMLYLVMPAKFMALDNQLRDNVFRVRGYEKPSGDVVIVDIDEKSLKQLGQWPWKRKDFAKVLQNLTDAGAGIIGLDIVFAEADNSNPTKVLKELGLDTTNVEDYDAILGQTVASTPTILGYIFISEDDGVETTGSADIPAIFIEKNKPKQDFVIEAFRTVLNVPIIQENAYSSGFFNTLPDEDGIIRSVPLIMKYDGVIYPSLSMEMIRIMSEASKVYINYEEDIGVSSVISGGIEIPTDSFGRMFVDYRGPAYTFPYISAADIYNNDFKAEDVAGKFILIGTSALGLMDLRATPYDSVYPGVEVHANVIDNILNGDFISKPSWVVAADLTWIFVSAIFLSFLFGLYSAFVTLLIFVVSLFAQLALNYYLLFFEGIALNILFDIILLSTILFIVSMVLNYFLETKQKNMIKGKFSSKVSPQVMEDLLKNPDATALEGQEREITVFFSDVRGFTNISEAMGDAKSLIKFMNEIMEPMTDIITKENGTVDKFIGDAIMAYWNAPQDVPDHADSAVRATLKQLFALEKLNADLRANEEYINVTKMSDENGVPIVDIGIGLNTGVAVVGEMGSTGRSDYTVIGDPINLGARLESLCKYYNSKLNISNFTKAKLNGDYIFRFLDLVTVKGKKEPIEIWQIHDFVEIDESRGTLFNIDREALLKELEYYHKAIDFYKKAKFADALEIFKDINSWENKTNLKIYDIYIERCEHYIEEPPKDFNGVFVHTTKG